MRPISSDPDLLGRKWYRIDILKGDAVYDRISFPAASDRDAERQAECEARKLAMVGKNRTVRLYTDDRSRLIATKRSE